MKVKRKKQPAPTLTNAAGHLRTVVTHKYLVAQGCFAVGLYRQGILHDLSKFSPTEFMVGARYWQGNRSPNNAERETIGYSSSWLHHKGRNRHHYEYWVDYNLRGEIDGQILIPVKMPGRYVVEMLMDRIAASKVYKGDDYTDASALEYYRGGRPELLMHPETAALLEKLLTMLAEKGEKETFAYVRARLHKGGLFDR
jgi:hypothetical protein